MTGGADDGEGEWSTREPPKHAWRRSHSVLIAALTFGMATGATGTYTLAALSPFVVAELGMSAGGVGLLACAIYVTAAGSSGFLGRRADTIDPAHILFVGATCSLLATIVFVLAPNSMVLVLFAVLAGLAMAASNPGSNGMIATRLAPGSRAYATGIKQSGATGTGLYIASVAPALAVLVGWRWAALASVAIPVLAYVTVLLSRHERIAEATSAPGGNAIGAQRRLTWLKWLSAYALMLGVATGSCNAFYVLYASEQLGFGPVQAGFVFALFALVSVVARVAWAKLSERDVDIGLLFVVISMIGAMSAVLCLVAPVAGAWAMWTAAALAGGSIVGWNALAMVTIMHNVPLAAVGASSARMLRQFFFGLAGGPLIFGLVVELAGYAFGWALQFSALVVAMVFAVLLGRALRGGGKIRAQEGSLQ